MTAKFVIKRGESGKFHFNLLAANGQVIVSSQHYATKEAALNGIKSVRSGAAAAPVEDETRHSAAV